MNSHARSRTLRPRFIPRLDALEDRWCPAAIQVIGHTLFVIGDAGANQVAIQDGGNGQVDATIDGLTASRSGINAIVVLAGAGNDSVSYSLNNTLTQLMAVAVYGGSGDDTIKATANADIAADAALLLYLDGGFGADTISVDYQGQLQGALAAVLNGGAGNDTLTANVALNAGSTGYLAAALYGGAGTDAATLNVTGDTTQLSAFVTVVLP